MQQKGQHRLCWRCLPGAQPTSRCSLGCYWKHRAGWHRIGWQPLRAHCQGLGCAVSTWRRSWTTRALPRIFRTIPARTTRGASAISCPASDDAQEVEGFASRCPSTTCWLASLDARWHSEMDTPTSEVYVQRKAHHGEGGTRIDPDVWRWQQTQLQRHHVQTRGAHGRRRWWVRRWGLWRMLLWGWRDLLHQRLWGGLHGRCLLRWQQQHRRWRGDPRRIGWGDIGGWRCLHQLPGQQEEDEGVSPRQRILPCGCAGHGRRQLQGLWKILWERSQQQWWAIERQVKRKRRRQKQRERQWFQRITSPAWCQTICLWPQIELWIWINGFNDGKVYYQW